MNEGLAQVCDGASHRLVWDHCRFQSEDSPMQVNGQSTVSPPISQLLAEFNALVPADKQLPYWKGRKVDLAAKLDDLKAEKTRRITRTIKDAAVELLLHVSHQDPSSGRPVGLPYDEVLLRIQQEFPDAETTVKCLRWYSVHLNKDPNVRMPYRPRRRVRRSSAAAA